MSIPQTVVSDIQCCIDRGLDKWQRQEDKFKFQVLLKESCKNGVYKFVATAHLEGEDGLSAWSRLV